PIHNCSVQATQSNNLVFSHEEGTSAQQEVNLNMLKQIPFLEVRLPVFGYGPDDFRAGLTTNETAMYFRGILDIDNINGVFWGAAIYRDCHKMQDYLRTLFFSIMFFRDSGTGPDGLTNSFTALFAINCQIFILYANACLFVFPLVP
ncbi:hypothetical protein ACJX0J_037775, partial [Zea mays]